MIAMSSTTIIYKAFDDLGLRKKQFTGLVLSMLDFGRYTCYRLDGDAFYHGGE